MRIAGTLSCSLVNGPGVRYVIFCQGCAHHCPGCHNSDTWDFNGGIEMIIPSIVHDIVVNHRHVDGVTLSGGDPFYQQKECVELLKHLPKRLNIWIYTGFLHEEIKDTELAKMADYIVDGHFEQDKIITGQYYGSSNQRIIKSEGNR